MSAYLLIKGLHVSAAVLSVLGFLCRAVLMLRRSPLAEARWVRQTPHYIDTVLLGAAIGLVWIGSWRPFEGGWLSVKMGSLLAYIVCGALALKRAPSERSRRFFLVLALLCLANILFIALSRDPWGLAGWLRPWLG
jgi:uncharacterized membrane protein SirB2